MRVLSLREVEDKKRDQEDFRIQKAEQINDLLREGTMALNDLRERDKKERERLAEVFLKFSEEIKNRKLILEAEVRELEERKSQALEPLERLDFEARKRLQEALDLGEKLRVQEEELVLKVESFEKESETIKTREDSLTQRDLEQKEAKDLIEVLNKEHKVKEKSFEEREQYFNEKLEIERSELEVRRQSLANERAEIVVQRRFNEDQRLKNDQERVRLNDRTATLESAFEELKKK